MKIRIIILNYNGEGYLKDCLPSIVEAAGKSKYRVTVSVIDNQSADRSVEIITEEFPAVELYRAPENRVLCSYNDYLKRVSEPIVILLNNDIRVDSKFIDPLIEPFGKNADCFMVTPKVMSFDGLSYEGGRSRSCLKYGIFWHASYFPGFENRIDKPGFTMAAGFGAFSREKFLELSGYDDLYLPGRLEDNDICFRAWRKGWSCFYEPESLVFHEGGKAFHEKFGRGKTMVLGHRNSFLFLWKNLRSPKFLIEHFIFLVPRLLVALLRGNRELVAGFFAALPRLKEALKRRRETAGEVSKRSDEEIFGLV